MPTISFSIGGAEHDISGKNTDEIMKMVYDNYAKKKTKKLVVKKTKCEDCDIINAEDFSYSENRCGDCVYKKDMRNREYERELEEMRENKISELDKQLDWRGVELLEIIQGLGNELKKKCATYEEGKLLISQAIEIGKILDKISEREY